MRDTQTKRNYSAVSCCICVDPADLLYVKKSLSSDLKLALKCRRNLIIKPSMSQSDTIETRVARCPHSSPPPHSSSPCAQVYSRSVFCYVQAHCRCGLCADKRHGRGAATAPCVVAGNFVVWTTIPLWSLFATVRFSRCWGALVFPTGILASLSNGDGITKRTITRA